MMHAQTEMDTLHYHVRELANEAHTQARCAAGDLDLGAKADVAKIHHELNQIGILTRKVAHQSGTLSSIGLPAIARDITLLAKLATTSCTKAIQAFLSQNAEEAKAAREDYATLTHIHRRLSSRFDSALGQPGTPVAALLAGWVVISSLAQIGGHSNRIASAIATRPQGETVSMMGTCS